MNVLQHTESAKGSYMNLKAILFDLDGTLLQLMQDTFIKTYLHPSAA